MKKKTKKIENLQMTCAQAENSSLETKKPTKKSSKSFEPEMVSEASTGPTGGMRRDVAGSIDRTDRFINIDNGLVPFRNSNAIYGPASSTVDIRDAVILCQKCYWN
jgi:hypothetical protein